MRIELLQYEDSIKKKSVWGFIPKYKEVFRTNLNSTLFRAIALKACEQLEWDVVYYEESLIEAVRRNTMGLQTEKIDISFDCGRVLVKSSSLGSEFFDFGRNSARVKLFIYAFSQVEKGYDNEALINLESETKSQEALDDYEIPSELPPPVSQKEPRLSIVVAGAMATSLLLGFIVAFLSLETVYLVFIYEIIFGLALALAINLFVQISNYTNLRVLTPLVMLSVFVIFFSRQYFEYILVKAEYNRHMLSFVQFIKYRFEYGFVVKDLNLGWIGLVISWGIQLVVTYVACMSLLVKKVLKKVYNRVAREVIDFAIYHFVKDKHEDQVRDELSKMGWSNPADQDAVFEAISALHGANTINREKYK